MDTAAAECERQADGQREETEGEKERGGENNVGDMKICEQAREQSRTCEKCSSVLFFQCVALTTCMKLGCHKMLNMVIISHTRRLDVGEQSIHSPAVSSQRQSTRKSRPHFTDENNPASTQLVFDRSTRDLLDNFSD